MNIGIDMDGVVIENDHVWMKYFNQNRKAHNHPIEAGLPDTWSYYLDICTECFNDCVHTADPNTPLMKGAKEGLEYLACHHDLYLISHRPPDLAQEYTKLFNKYGIYDLFAGVDWSFRPKIESCQEVGASILIDDSPKNIEDIQGTSVTPIIFDRPYNRHVLGIRAYGWEDVVSLFSRIDSFYAGVPA